MEELKKPAKKKPKKDVPYHKRSETEHGKDLHKWLDGQGIPHTHIGNESGQSGTGNIIAMMAKKKALGVSKGFPDYVIEMPFEVLYDVGVMNIQLCIELKKARGLRGGNNGSELHVEQAEWLKKLRKTPCVFTYVARGSEDAKEFVREKLAKLRRIPINELVHYWIDTMEEDLKFIEDETEVIKEDS